ncbi:acetylcholine receptor subunit alpha-like 1 isoform X2 [Phymastichus coffea]|uniref:acetylcholine receptor subunit alpha-like 1 isoform X2 n=1 Tax=Phymastichus coffea TaxID=108790 RepID=UPI00273C9EB1|nr:acetylcholine receptor subunit alpha-like 1 isoform X2 [Phymastichus coffea]
MLKDARTEGGGGGGGGGGAGKLQARRWRWRWRWRGAAAAREAGGLAGRPEPAGWLPPLLRTLLLAAALLAPAVQANPEAKRLYDDLLSNYNRLIRPVGNNSDKLTVKLGLRLSQLIDIEWNDYKLRWNPDDYGGVDTLHVPSEHIWLPDIVLYNNADGNYEVTIMTKAILHHTGRVIWKPPAIYKSFCEIDVEYFPFDHQTCFMKFGSWTYDGYTVDLRHMLQSEDSNKIEVAIDLTDYYISVEWDILKVPAVRNEKFYICCEEPYPDIIFYIELRRKTLFYTVNLIIPCVGISFLSVLVFYLPSHSGEKVSLSISVLLSLTVFFLLLVEIIPSTSITVPLLGKYLLFTMVLVTLSVVVTIAVLNVNFRSPVTHRMAPWVRLVFIDVLPRFLLIGRPKKDEAEDDNGGDGGGGGGGGGGSGATRDDDLQDLDKPPEAILTDVFHMPTEAVDKYGDYCGKRYSEYELPTLPTLPSLPAHHRHHHRHHHHQHGSPLRLEFAVPVDEPLSPPRLALPGCEDDMFLPPNASPTYVGHDDLASSPTFDRPLVREIERTMEDARFIAQHARNKDKYEGVEEDWKYVAMVIDRIFLWLFTVACIVGTALIIFQAPALYDKTKPIDLKYSKIAKKKMMLLNMLPEED